VTFKYLQKLVQSQSGPEQSQLIQRLKDKPFWIWDQKQHKQEDIKTKGDCCFNHIIRLPCIPGGRIAIRLVLHKMITIYQLFSSN
jgi:hypothetical protein